MANKYLYAIWNDETDSLFVSQNQFFVSDKKSTILKQFKKIKQGFLEDKKLSVKIYVRVNMDLSIDQFKDLKEN